MDTSDKARAKDRQRETAAGQHERRAGRQSQLLLPVLESIENRGGAAKSRQLYDDVAARIGLTARERSETTKIGSRNVNLHARNVRWAQQRARLEGLARRAGPDDWRLTGRGAQALRKSRPGLVIVLWTTANGVALFGDCQDAFGLIDRESISLLLTSPPYPLLTQKAYSNIADETAYIDWMLRLAETWTDRLRPDGSLVLNIGDVWEKGRPSLSLYQERLLIRLHDELGLRLAQRFAWFKPAALPAPAEWVAIRRIRVKPALETVLWLSKSDFPYADNRQVLVPYSESMKRAIAGGGQAAATKPSGYRMEEGAFSRDNGGSIPTNLLTAANTASSDIYMRRCRSAGLPIHPARFPAALAQFFIPLTTRKEDLVVDPFAGSFTVARVAESLGRRWIGSEQVLEYAMGGRPRFEDHELTR